MRFLRVKKWSVSFASGRREFRFPTVAIRRWDPYRSHYPCPLISYRSKGRLSECGEAIGERQVNRGWIPCRVIHMALRWSGESRPGDRSYKGPVDGRRGRESRPGEDLYRSSIGVLPRSLFTRLIAPTNVLFKRVLSSGENTTFSHN